MKKYFNIAGPCNESDHYMLPVQQRSTEILPLIEQKQYFVIHAAMQTGKTTIIQHLTKYLNSKDDFYALYCSLEAASIYSDAKEGIPEIFNIIRYSVSFSNLPFKEKFGENEKIDTISILIKSALTNFCILLDKPLVIFFDEIDSLKDDTLLSFLRQLRDGYVNRSSVPFPSSIGLVGMRNIRDYKNKIREDNKTLGSASPFNIISEALTVINFSFENIEQLLSQHTQLTGQVFEKDAIAKIYQQTAGQPWLVNAVARETVHKILNNDYSKNITSALVEQAIKNIILRRDTHIDSLLFRLKEERVRKVIEPIILGTPNEINILDDDTQYCLNLGIIKNENKILTPANKIYNEVIIRELSYNTQYHLETQVKNIWITKDNKIEMSGLLKGFQQFWRENSKIWIEKYDYKEAAPHLILQAFLQRIINGGGHILREYAAGSERMDICVVYQNYKYPIELKIKYSKSVKEKGIEQLSNYMDTIGEKEGWLIIFDRNPETSWDSKISWETVEYQNKTINIVGC